MTEVGSYQVRAELETLLERDLLGPWDGENEELPPGTPPSERYLIGRLVPRPRSGQQATAMPTSGNAPSPDGALNAGKLPPQDTDLDDDPDVIDTETTDAAEEAGSEVAPTQAARTGSMAACALGLSFRVPIAVQTLVVQASWGSYAPAPSDLHVTEQGRPRKVWRRTPSGGRVTIDLTTPDTGSILINPDGPPVVLRVTVRDRATYRMVDVALINDQLVSPKSPDLSRLYQASLQISAPDGHAAVFLGHNDPELQESVDTSDDERRHLALLYRFKREFAHGRQCAVNAEVRNGEQRAWQLQTTNFPAADVALTVSAGSACMPGLILDMARLGSPELAGDELVRALRPLTAGYRTWISDQRQRLGEEEISRYEPAGTHALDTAEAVALRLDRAIGLLGSNGLAREAFRFANQAMALQRVRSQVTRERLADPESHLSELLTRFDVPAQRSWRPFQLAFVLLCLPGLTDPSHPDAGRGSDDGEAQLLFFPTGGGKTEAYLGLAAYTFAIRRLQGVIGDGLEKRDGTQGVAVLMRYTLRLLTAQQFQRAAALLCACEWLRRERIAAGDGRWGATPFRVGLWVGSKVTPNSFTEASRQVSENRGGNEALGGPLQLAACPWCGQRLSGSDLSTDDKRRRVLLYCAEPEGHCPFSRRNSPGEGLPVLTVDEEIYRLTPALVIATVDKFAQLPWRAATATLFGLVDQRCPRHGWKSPDFEDFCKGSHQRTSVLPKSEPEGAMRLRPPDLIIQDELHLISNALGSMVGLYETAVDRLCSRTTNTTVVRPLLVASTATVRRARDQVEQVFARSLTVFPPPVLDAGETFFSTVAPVSATSPSRRYRGVCATGERIKAVEIRVATAVMTHAQYLFDRYGKAADPYMTLVDYFTSTRELAGMRRLVEDDVADRLANPQGHGTKRKRPIIAELTSRMPSSRIATTLADLEHGFDPALDTNAALEEFRARTNKEAAPKTERQFALDVLLATSMLQVGVDVQRLGLMMVTGQPKSTAEYIQATSRIGRDPARPGLVLTVYQWNRPRDLAHYESFAYDHATFGMRVEGVATTPFSDRALDRGLTAVLVAALRHHDAASLPNTAAGTLALSGPAIQAVLGAIEARAAVVTHDPERARRARQAAQYRLDSWDRKRSPATGQLGYQVDADVTGLLARPDTGTWDTWTAPMSLREVEPDIALQLDRRDASLEDSPAFSYDRPSPEGAR